MIESITISGAGKDIHKFINNDFPGSQIRMPGEFVCDSYWCGMGKEGAYITPGFRLIDNIETSFPEKEGEK